MVYRHLLNFWPLVPSIDLQNVAYHSKLSTLDSVVKGSEEPFQSYKLRDYSSTKEAEGTDEDFNCLLLGGSLGCMMKTLCRTNRHGNRNLNLYVADVFPESITRSLLLLSLLNGAKFSVLEKTENFLEIFGNTYIRSSTGKYVDAASLVLVTDLGLYENSIPSLPIVSMELLKQREIDELVKVLTSLRNKNVSYDIGKAWDNSLRSFYGPRYDSRANLFDYHFNIKFRDYSVINVQKYIDWCETGIAFKFRKSKYNFPNKTLGFNLSNINDYDSFVGDIATSPYLAFGVESGNQDLFKKANKQYVNTSEDISKFNVTDMITEYMDFKQSESKREVKIHFMFFDTFLKTGKFEKSFDAVYIPCDMMHYANQVLPKYLKEDGVAVFETVKNVVNSTKQQKEKHANEIDKLTSKSGLKSLLKETHILANFKIYKLVTI